MTGFLPVLRTWQSSPMHGVQIHVHWSVDTDTLNKKLRRKCYICTHDTLIASEDGNVSVHTALFTLLHAFVLFALAGSNVH